MSNQFVKSFFMILFAALLSVPILGQDLGSFALNGGFVTQSAISGSAVSKADEQVIFEIGNIYGVQNNPTAATKFTLTKAYFIASIQNYHWNNAQGARPGTISLLDSTGHVYGPWQTRGSPGQGGVPNAYWTATLNTRLGPGEFTVIDSDPATWARNSQSGNRGFTRIMGHAAIAPASVYAITENRWNQNVLIWVSGSPPRSMQDVLNYHLEPGWKGTLKVSIPESGNLTFVVGDGKASSGGGPQHQYDNVIASCNWHGDPSDTTKVPFVIFQSDKTLTCSTKQK